MGTRRAVAFVLLLAWLGVSTTAAEESRFRVLRDGKWGFIDEAGDVVIPLQYDYAFPFREGFTVVRRGEERDGKRAFIDPKGTMVTDFIFDRAYHFQGGVATGVIDGQWYVVSTDGRILNDGNGFSWILDFHGGYAGALLRGDEGRLWGLIDAAGNEVLPIRYYGVRYAGAGLWWIGQGRNAWALYAPGEPTPEEFPFYSTGTFDGDYAIVSVQDEGRRIFQLIGTDGVPVFRTVQTIQSLAEGIVCLVTSRGLVYLDSDGTQLNSEPFFSASPFDDGIARVSLGSSRSDQRWGILRADGTYLVEPRYDFLGAFNEDGLARYRVGNLFGFVDQGGAEITPPIYENSGEFSHGLCAVLSDAKWGYIDTAGKVAIPLLYDYAWDFRNGYAVVRLGDRETGERLFLDTSGAELSGDRYDWAYSFEGGLAHVAAGDYDTGMFGYINDQGEVIWPPSH